MSNIHRNMVKSVVVLLSISMIDRYIKATEISPSAQTQQGIYIGRQTTINDTNVNFWLGIPYAQQPVGNLRWKPPEALAFSNGTEDAYVSNTCPQQTNFGVPFTEACLTLNVYAPENARNLPVFVWIHGGGFTMGAGTFHNATSFVSTSVKNSVSIVAVTINYRLGLLGFLADEALYNEKTGINNRSTTGNYGILDQMMALDWIKKNIAAFGGNPEQITIGGQSAGGVSSNILLTSPLVPDGTFQRVIVHSGNIWPSLMQDLQAAINNTGNVLRASTNCSTVRCLRNLTIDQILVVQNILASKNLIRAAALPTIDNYVLYNTMENYFAKGDFQKVPILLGSTANETSLLTCAMFNYTASIAQVEAFFKMLYNDTILDNIPTIYGPIAASTNPLTYLNIVYGDSWMHCGSRRIAAQFASYGLPSYLYTYSHVLRPEPACSGAAHSNELVMLFPSMIQYLYPGYHLTVEEQQLSTNMMLYWANFIHKSNPNYIGNPTNWDAYNPSTDDDIVLDVDLQMRNHYYNPTCSHFWDLYAVTNS